VEAALIHADRQTDGEIDTTKFVGAFDDLREEGLTNLTLSDDVVSPFYREQYKYNWFSM
jgi:hypothetical protein